MTEDDTFNALRRIPFEEIRQLFLESVHHRGNHVHDIWKKQEEMLDQFMEPHGWTYREYYLESIRRL